jgi:hypothetical protein
MDKSMEKLVEILSYKEDPMYERVLGPILKDVTIDSLDKILTNRDSVIEGLFEQADAETVYFPTFGELEGKGFVRKVAAGFRTLKPFVVEDGLKGSEGNAGFVNIGSEPVHFEEDVTVVRSTIDSQAFLSKGSIIEYSTFPRDHQGTGKSFVGPKSIVSEAIIRKCVISGNENGKENDTYIHPSMLLDTLVGYGAQISFSTVSLSHPLHDGSAPFVDPVTYRTFDTNRRKNPSFIGSQRKIGNQILKTKVGSNVTLNSPFAIGSGHVVDNNTKFYGIAWLEEERSGVITKILKKHEEPEYGLDPMPFAETI